MATYRIQVEHARYWRGAPHRWSTVYHMLLAATRAPIDSSACDVFANAEKPLLWPGSPAIENGISSISIYGPSGGVPIASRVYFDWKTPASWIAAGLGTAWGTKSGIQVAEACMTVHSPIGLSRTGKPVLLKKWYHGVPSVQDSSTPDIVSADQATLLAAFNTLTASLTSTYGLVYASPAGGIPGSSTVQPFFGNHQMPRGRKLKLITADGKSYRGRAINPAPVIEAD